MKKLLLPALLLLGITLSGNPQAYVDNWLNPAPYDNWRSPAPTDSSRYIKVMTFNILHGATTRGDFDLDAIARVIKDENPDLVALQEVDFKTRRARGYDLATELGWRTGMASLFARAMPYDGGEYGEAVLSKWSFISSRNVALPYSPGNEPRAALETTMVTGAGDTIIFIGTHLDHLRTDTDRVAQAEAISEIFSETRYPAILAGDLNDIPGSRAISIIEKDWKATYQVFDPEFTFPSDSPVKKIDYIMLKPAGAWRLISGRPICDTIASDHCAYVVILEPVKD
jgi:endonuclease/exonuclease/phosphatase family metal-dependent hydrolase